MLKLETAPGRTQKTPLISNAQPDVAESLGAGEQPRN
jgi:hypothetical protein